MATSLPTWQHSESDPRATAQNALSTARAGAWTAIDRTTQIRYLRALLTLTLQAGRLRTDAPRPRGPESDPEYGDYRASDYPDATRLAIASTVLRTPMLLLDRGPHAVTQTAKSIDGEPLTVEGPEHTFETGLPPVVMVVGIVAAASAVIAVVHHLAQVVDRKLERDEDTRRLLGSQANAISLIGSHLDRETKAGHPLDWTPQELELLHVLEGAQKQIADKQQAPLPSPFPGASKVLSSLGDGAQNALGKIGQGLETGLGIALPLVAVGAVLWWFSSNKKDRVYG